MNSSMINFDFLPIIVIILEPLPIDENLIWQEVG